MQGSQHPSTSMNTSHNDRESAEALRHVASALLQQACQFLEQVISRDDGERIMTHESQHIPGSTIGKHLRHSLDHYRLLMDAASSSKAKSTPLDLNYDIRVRLLDMETDPKAALDVFRNMDQQLSRVVARTALDKPIRLTALTPYHQEFDTSFGRELWFVALHAIHHFSLLKVIASGELGLELSPTFGVAPSTLAFREVSKATDSDNMSSEEMERKAEKVAGKVKL